MKKLPPDKKVVVSFAVDPRVKAQLVKLNKHTTFISAWVAASLGVCPVCFNQWPKKPEGEDDGR